MPTLAAARKPHRTWGGVSVSDVGVVVGVGLAYFETFRIVLIGWKVLERLLV